MRQRIGWNVQEEANRVVGPLLQELDDLEIREHPMVLDHAAQPISQRASADREHRENLVLPRRQVLARVKPEERVPALFERSQPNANQVGFRNVYCWVDNLINAETRTHADLVST